MVLPGPFKFLEGEFYCTYKIAVQLLVHMGVNAKYGFTFA
jgi:hypothetical protein